MLGQLYGSRGAPLRYCALADSRNGLDSRSSLQSVPRSSSAAAVRRVARVWAVHSFHAHVPRVRVVAGEGGGVGAERDPRRCEDEECRLRERALVAQLLRQGHRKAAASGHAHCRITPAQPSRTMLVAVQANPSRVFVFVCFPHRRRFGWAGGRAR